MLVIAWINYQHCSSFAAFSYLRSHRSAMHPRDEYFRLRSDKVMPTCNVARGLLFR
jgi:hypothetical protein